MIQRSVAIFRLHLFKPSETFIPGQVSRLARWKPTYVGRSLMGPVPEDADVRLVAGSRFSGLRFGLLADPAPVLASFGSWRPELIHAHFGIDATLALPVARRLGVPLVTTLHGFDVTTKDREFLTSGRPALINAVIRRPRLQRQGDLFICVSEFIRRRAVALGFPDDRTVSLPIGIDVERFIPSTGREMDLVVHVARLVEKKGTIHLLRALARTTSPMRLAIIGDGPLRGELEAEAIRLGVSERIIFLGAQNHSSTIAWMRRAAVIAVPSVTAANGDSEGLPTVVFESGALGVPVVASRTSGIPEAVVDGETGFLIEERDEAGLAAALSRLASDAALRDSMGAAARRLMETSFNIAAQTSALEVFYDQALAARGRHGAPDTFGEA